MAELCLRRGWSPYGYVRFCVGQLQGSGSFVVASDLSDGRLVSAYEKAVREESDDTSPESEWRFNEQELYKRAGENREAGTRFLMSPLYPFPAWYRFAKGNRRIREAWGEMAREDLARRPDVARFLSERLPKRMEMLEKAGKGGAT